MQEQKEMPAFLFADISLSLFFKPFFFISLLYILLLSGSLHTERLRLLLL